MKLPKTQSGVAGALLSTLLDRVEAEVVQQRLAAHYAIMFPGEQDDPQDAEGLATDRALAAATLAAHGQDGEHSAPAHRHAPHGSDPQGTQ